MYSHLDSPPPQTGGLCGGAGVYGAGVVDGEPVESSHAGGHDEGRRDGEGEGAGVHPEWRVP